MGTTSGSWGSGAWRFARAEERGAGSCSCRCYPELRFAPSRTAPRSLFLIAPARPEEQLSALAAPAVAHDEERVAEEAEGELAAAAPVQPRGRQAPALPSVEHPAHVVERHQLELEDARRPQQGVTGLDSAEQLAASHEARVVEAAERAVPAHRGEGAVARFHRELGRERRRGARPLAGETRGEDG